MPENVSASHTMPKRHVSQEQPENPRFLTEQVITYIGNKRALLNGIEQAVRHVRKQTNKKRLVMFDAFSGSGIVARAFKRFADRIYANDQEAYSHCLNSCYLANASDIDLDALAEQRNALLKDLPDRLQDGFITELYAPKDDNHIQKGERVFFSRRNAQFIDTVRQRIDTLPEKCRRFFLAPLIYGASVHNNTAGVFKGFYKNADGIGQFGGTARNALTRILGDIELPLPVFSNFDCECLVSQADALTATHDIAEDLDLAYLDPPYNQHPYGSNYFMLNLILNYQRPTDLSQVSGIPKVWNHSQYNQKYHAKDALFQLIDAIPARFILISYNSEGFVNINEFLEFLAAKGKLTVRSTDYNTFRACRNLKNRNIYVKEYLFLLEKH